MRVESMEKCGSSFFGRRLEGGGGPQLGVYLPEG